MTNSWPDIAGRLEGRTHMLPVRVYYEDTDFSGVVYHASYFRFCERGRSDFLRLAGINHTELHRPADGSEPSAFAVTRIEADFVDAGRIDDLLEVRTRFTAIKSARLLIEQEISRNGARLFGALVTVVLLNNSGRPQRIGRRLSAELVRFLPD